MKPYYQRNGITIYHGDCLDVLPTLEADSVDLALTDPPYNVGFDYAGGHDDTMRPEQYLDWCRDWFLECRRVTRYSVVLTVGITNLSMWLADVERTGAIIAWVKENQCSFQYIGAKSGSNIWEPILVYGRAKTIVRRDAFSIPISQQSDTGDHPCPKSLKAWKRLVNDFTEPGDLILDPFLGSGTTAVAALHLGRRCVAIERSERYCEIAANRLAQDVLPLEISA